MSPKPVLIIGSGLGGLALGHALRKHHIPFHIYERDTASESRAQGYRIRINDEGLEALKRCLSSETYELFEQTCARNESGIGRLDPITGEKIPGGPGPGHPRPASQVIPPALPTQSAPGAGPPRPAAGMFSLPADRKIMRSVLLSSLQPFVTYSSCFTEYVTSSSGVIARFDNGSESVEGSLLVGADGTWSKVARQLGGPQLAPLDSEWRMIYGKTPLTSDLEDVMGPKSQKGMVVVADKSEAGQLTLFLETMRFAPDHPMKPSNYVYWVLSGDSATLGKDDNELFSPGVAQPLSRALTKHWHPSIRPILDLQDPNSTAVLKMTSAPIIPNGIPIWQTDRRVTILGDAVHNMPPTGGSGANTALKDAACLADVLSQGEIRDDGWTEEDIASYEDSMRSYWSNIVARSNGAAMQLFGLKPHHAQR